MHQRECLRERHVGGSLDPGLDLDVDKIFPRYERVDADGWGLWLGLGGTWSGTWSRRLGSRWSHWSRGHEHWRNQDKTELCKQCGHGGVDVLLGVSRYRSRGLFVRQRGHERRPVLIRHWGRGQVGQHHRAGQVLQGRLELGQEIGRSQVRGQQGDRRRGGGSWSRGRRR